MTPREIPPPPDDPGAGAVDDHVVTPFPKGIGHQPTGTIDDESRREQMTPSWQGVRPEHVPDPDREPPPEGESEGGSGAEPDSKSAGGSGAEPDSESAGGSGAETTGQPNR